MSRARTILTAPERETIISWSDADDTAGVYTAQTPVMTRLRRHPHARLLAEHRINGRIIALEFELPITCISFSRRPRGDKWRGLVRGGGGLRRGGAPGSADDAAKGAVRVSPEAAK